MKVSKKDKRLLDGIAAGLFNYDKQLFTDKIEEEVAKARELSINIENSLRNSFDGLLAKSKEEFAIANIGMDINLLSVEESQARANYVATERLEQQFYEFLINDLQTISKKYLFEIFAEYVYVEFMELKHGDKKEAEAEDEIKNEKEEEE